MPERKNSCLGKDGPNLAILRRKKHVKSEFVRKIIITCAAFSSFYHEQISVIYVNCWPINTEKIVNAYRPPMSEAL